MVLDCVSKPDVEFVNGDWVENCEPLAPSLTVSVMVWMAIATALRMSTVGDLTTVGSACQGGARSVKMACQ